MVHLLIQFIQWLGAILLPDLPHRTSYRIRAKTCVPAVLPQILLEVLCDPVFRVTYLLINKTLIFHILYLFYLILYIYYNH